ncbi:hypothetical protein PG989_001781 [Apiospora arundinis]
MSPYEQPLDPSRSETRLLTLLPAADFDAEIQCLLDVVSLDETTDFEALSYVWGDPTIREPISVGGENVLVTTSLIAALRRLRQPKSRRVLWVDAVCIDQNHTAEKNAQLPLLARIYRSARSVIAWLGEPTEEMEATILWAQEYFNEAAISGSTSSSVPKSPSLSHLYDNEKEEKTPNVSYIVKLGQIILGHKQFAELTYWKRMWTLQEYRLPKTEPISMCGPYSFFTTQLLQPATVPLLWEFIDQAEQVMEDSQELSSYDRPDRGTVPRIRPNPKLVTNCEDVEQGSLSPTMLWAMNINRQGKAVLDLLGAQIKIANILSECLTRANRERSSEVRALGSNLESPTPEFESAVRQHGKTLKMVIEHAYRAGTIHSSVLEQSRNTLEGAPCPMVELLEDSRKRQCHDVKDKVYALYSMGPEALQLLYPPDYHKHPGQIFQETAAYILQYEYRGARQMFQEYGFQGLEGIPGMSSYPSWVPKFGTDGLKNGPKWGLLHDVSNRLTQWANDRPPQISNGLQILETQALLLGKVIILLEFGETSEAIEAQIASSLPEQGNHVNGKETLVHLCTKDNCVNPYNSLREQFENDMNLLVGKRLVVTESGNLGICPSSTRDGDLAAFLPFLAKLAILREWDKPSTRVANTHKIVGPALFPVLHKGEGWLNNKVVDDVLAQEPARLFIE